MKTLNPILLAALLSVQTLSAAPMPVQLGRISEVIPQDSNVTRVKYRIETGPGAKKPSSPPNLTNEQLSEMAKFLVPYPKNPPKNMSPELFYRLMFALGQVDMNFKRPIAKAEWDQRLQEMREEFVKQNGQPGSAVKSADEWEKSIDDMISGFIKKLGDPHTVFMNREQAKRFREQTQGSFVGIGASLEKASDGVMLTTVFPGSPAEKAGLLDGDVVTTIDGATTKDQDLQVVVGRIRGAAGTSVEISVKRLSRPVTVVRGAIQTEDLFGKMAAPGIGYVYFSQFNCRTQAAASCTDARLFAKIDQLKASGATKLIIDLRGNGGGLLSVAESIGSEFLQDKDVITMTKSQGQLATKAVTDGRGRYYGMPLAFILNGHSASASEVLSAGVKEHGNAIVVGSISYGKGSFQSILYTQIPIFKPGVGAVAGKLDGTIVKVTEGGWYTPNDLSVEGVHDPATERNIPGSGGVKPDVEVSMTPEEETAVMKGIMLQLNGRPTGPVKDAALEKAVEALNSR